MCYGTQIGIEMTENIRSVDGRQFRTQSDYNRALLDKKVIDAIRVKYNFNNKNQLEQLLREIHSEKYKFYTLLGRDLQDEIEEELKNINKAVPSRPQINISKKKGKVSSAKKYTKSKLNKEILEQFVEEELKKQEKKRKLLVILCSIAAVGCLGYFTVYSYYDYKTTQSYQALTELKDKKLPKPIQNETPVINYTKEEQEIPEVLEDYKSLVNKNKKLIGWVEIDDTNISYPVMQTTNNEYYLDHNLNQEYSKNGSIFMDKDCDVLKPSTNFILYGHHMKSGQMFGKLDLYSSEEYYKKHNIIKFDTIYEKGTYEIMYVFRTKIYNEEDIVFKYYQFIDALSEQEFDSYMQEMAEMSFYDTGVTAQYGDQLLTLSTCDYNVNDGRFVVVAKKIE